jgi:quinol monooxygenase YgiN
MSDNVFFVVELEIKPVQLDDLRSVALEMVDLSRENEPGTLNYEYFLSRDGSVCHIYERYADTSAVLAHNRSYPADLSQRGMAFRPTRLTAYGTVTDAIRAERIDSIEKAIPAFSAVYLQPLAGFAR